MMPTLSSQHPEPYRRSRDFEANLLAELLRTSRLTVLYGEAGSGKTTLLKSGVMPLLHRRATDDASGRAKGSGSVVPFPDRRARNKPAGSGAEVAIFLDAWNEPPLAALQGRIHAALSISGKTTATLSAPLLETLAAWSKQLGIRFLIILDNFDDYIAAPLDQPGMREFADEFVRVMKVTSLPVNFLVALRNDAGPSLTRFRERVPGFGDACVRLLPLHHFHSTPVMPQSAKQPPAQNSTIRGAEDKSTRLINWRAERQAVHGVATLPQAEPFESAQVRALPVGEPILKRPDSVRAAAVANFSGNEFPHDLKRESAPFGGGTVALPAGEGRGWKRLLALIGLILLSVLVGMLALILWPSAELALKEVTGQFSPPMAVLEPERPAPAATAVAPIAVAPTGPIPTPVPALPGLEIMADAGNSTDWRVAQDLARFVAGDTGTALGVKPSTNWVESLDALRGQPRLAIAHYDALQAARADATAGQPIAPLRIVMPLFAEEIYFITRRNSPLDYIHEIKGARINIGPTLGNRALTASTLYERMFGTRIPLSDVSVNTGGAITQSGALTQAARACPQRAGKPQGAASLPACYRRLHVICAEDPHACRDVVSGDVRGDRP